MQKQKGMTLIGMLTTAAVVFLAAVVLVRVIPGYLDYFTLKRSIESLSALPSSELTGDSEANIARLKKDVNKRLEINGIEPLKENELVITDLGGNHFKVELKYQDTRHLMYNVSLMFDFTNTFEVVLGSEN
jgi:hypothetical protein